MIPDNVEPEESERDHPAIRAIDLFRQSQGYPPLTLAEKEELCEVIRKSEAESNKMIHRLRVLADYGMTKGTVYR